MSDENIIKLKLRDSPSYFKLIPPHQKNDNIKVNDNIYYYNYALYPDSVLIKNLPNGDTTITHISYDMTRFTK